MRLIFGLLRFLLTLAGLAVLLEFLRSLFGPGNSSVLPPSPGKKWLTCGRGSGQSNSDTIGPAGGTLRLHGHLLTIPAGAVSRDTRFTLHEPPTPQVMVIATCAGPFGGNLSLTISWARCGPGVDPSDPEIIRDDGTNLGGIVRGQTITTDRVDHLSRFIIATG